MPTLRRNRQNRSQNQTSTQRKPSRQSRFHAPNVSRGCLAIAFLLPPTQTPSFRPEQVAFASCGAKKPASPPIPPPNPNRLCPCSLLPTPGVTPPKNLSSPQTT